MSLDDECIIKQMSQIKSNDKDKPSILSLGSGVLLLTNKRLVYLKSRLGLTYYDSVEDFERDLKKKGSFEIPVSKITGIESDQHLMVPYIRVTHDAKTGSKTFSFWPETIEDMAVFTSWVEVIFHEMKKARGDLEYEEKGVRERSIFIVDQSHDQDDRGISKIVDIVNDTCSQLQLAEPFAIQGKPSDELLLKNKHLLPDAVGLMSIGTQSGEKFSLEERELITEYVRNGGRLLLAAYPPYEPPNEILEPFGIEFIANSIEDEEHHAGRHKDHIIVEDLVDHRINEGVKSIRMGKFGCYPIKIENPRVTILAYSSGVADPPQAPIAAIVPHESGMVLAIGQTRLFQDDLIEEHDNTRWLKNIIEYLVTEQIETVPIAESRAVTESKIISYCPYCGAKLSEGDIFCGKCGQRIAEPA